MSQMTTEKRERKAMRAERRRRKEEVCELPGEAEDDAWMDDSDSQWTDLEEEEVAKGPKKIKKKLAKKIVVISSSVK